MVKTAKRTRPVPYPDLRFDHFKPSDRKVMHWAPYQMDVQRIASIAGQVKSPGRELPVVLDIGAATGLLSYLVARTDRAAVMGIDPYEPYMTKPAYRRRNLRFYHAGVEWSIANLKGEIDLAVWSWPLTGLKPFERLQALDPRAVLMIFDIRDWRIGIGMSEWIRYMYSGNFDKFEGFRKALMWQGISYLELAAGNNACHFPRYNNFVLYVNERLNTEIKEPQEQVNGGEYRWITEAREKNPNFPEPTPVKLIDNGYVLCPEGEWI